MANEYDERKDVPPEPEVVAETRDPHGATPGLQDMFTETGQGQKSMVEELLKTSEIPSEYWGRSVITEQMLQRKRRIQSHFSIIYEGLANVMGLQWVDIVARQSIGGLAREQVVKIMGGGGGVTKRAMNWIRGNPNGQDQQRSNF